MDVEEIARISVDCGFRVHDELGPGLLESVYEAVLTASLGRVGLQVERQVPIAIEFEGIRLSEGFRADLLVGGATFREGVKRIVNNHHAFASSRLRVHQSIPPSHD